MKCKSILIVEDNYDIRETVEDVLRTEGYLVYSVSNGREALRALRNMPGPCLILLDMMMPLMNGWEFVQAKKANAVFAEFPVVVISALNARLALNNESTLVDACGYLQKPIDLEPLMEIVRYHCEMPIEAKFSSPRLRGAEVG